jgi:hypothetical protein
MKWLSLIFLCALAGAQCSPTTANLGLATPPYNASGWNTCLNTNFTVLDNYLSGVSILPAFKAAGLTLSGTGLTSNTGTFSGNVSIAGTLTAGSFALSNLSLSGTLGVSGASTLAALSATTGAFSSTLSVSGTSTLAALIATTGSFSGQITSTQTTGTAPFSIASTTPVPNLTTTRHALYFSCGTGPSCSNTPVTSGATLFGSVVLSGGTRTVSGITVYSNSFSCVGIDGTAANAVSIIPSGTNAFTVTGTGTDVIYYVCNGS